MPQAIQQYRLALYAAFRVSFHHFLPSMIRGATPCIGFGMLGLNRISGLNFSFFLNLRKLLERVISDILRGRVWFFGSLYKFPHEFLYKNLAVSGMSIARMAWPRRQLPPLVALVVVATTRVNRSWVNNTKSGLLQSISIMSFKYLHVPSIG